MQTAAYHHLRIQNDGWWKGIGGGEASGRMAGNARLLQKPRDDPSENPHLVLRKRPSEFLI